MRRRGQSTLEYVYLLGIIGVAIIVMAVYIKRGFQGNFRNLADQTGEQYSLGNTQTELTKVTHYRSSDSYNKDTREAISNSTVDTVTSGREVIDILANEKF